MSQYPRIMASAVVTGFYGEERERIYRGVLDRLMPDGSRKRLAECPHHHRARVKALDCAEQLAALDGAPQV